MSETEQSATSEEIAEWEEENDEPHPIFQVAHRPERERLEFKDRPQDTENDR